MRTSVKLRRLLHQVGSRPSHVSMAPDFEHRYLSSPHCACGIVQQTYIQVLPLFVFVGIDQPIKVDQMRRRCIMGLDPFLHAISTVNGRAIASDAHDEPTFQYDFVSRVVIPSSFAHTNTREP